MEERCRTDYVVRAELMIFVFLLMFGALKWLTLGRVVNAESGQVSSENENYIQWVDFNVSYEALSQAYDYDIETYMSDAHVNWIELLAYLAVRRRDEKAFPLLYEKQPEQTRL